MSALRYNPVIFAASLVGQLAGGVDITEPDDTLSSNAILNITATAAITEPDDTLASAATLKIVATLSVTEDDDTLTDTTSLIFVSDENRTIIMSKPNRSIKYRMRSRIATMPNYRIIHV